MQIPTVRQLFEDGLFPSVAGDAYPLCLWARAFSSQGNFALSEINDFQFFLSFLKLFLMQRRAQVRPLLNTLQ